MSLFKAMITYHQWFAYSYRLHESSCFNDRCENLWSSQYQIFSIIKQWFLWINAQQFIAHIKPQLALLVSCFVYNTHEVISVMDAMVKEFDLWSVTEWAKGRVAKLWSDLLFALHCRIRDIDYHRAKSNVKRTLNVFWAVVFGFPNIFALLIFFKCPPLHVWLENYNTKVGSTPFYAIILTA